MTITSRVYDPHAIETSIYRWFTLERQREERDFGATAIDGGGKWLGGLGKRELGRESET